MTTDLHDRQVRVGRNESLFRDVNGTPELAISGGPAADRLDEAMEAVAKVARDALTT